MKKIYWIILISGIILTFVAPLILTRPALFQLFDFSETGSIGSTIGGITAPILSFIGILLILVSLLEQYKVNKKIAQKNEADFIFNMFLNCTSVFDSFSYNEKNGSIAFHTFGKSINAEILEKKFEFIDLPEFGDFVYLVDYLDELIFLILASIDMERFTQLKVMDRVSSFYKNKIQKSLLDFEKSCETSEISNDSLIHILAIIDQIEARMNDYRELITGK